MFLHFQAANGPRRNPRRDAVAGSTVTGREWAETQEHAGILAGY